MSNPGLELNKIVAAILLAGVIAMVSGLIAEGLYKGTIADTEGKPEKRGYTIAGAAPAESGEAAAPEQKPVDIKPYLAKADVKAGEAQLQKCASCHTFDKGGKNGVGPNQWGVVGGPFDHKDDYSYSSALMAFKGKRTWTFQELSDFLASPGKDIPGTKMSFAGIPNPQDRANLIAYLDSLSDKPVPLSK